MRLQRDWYLPDGRVYQDNPTAERDCGSSLKWLCTYCGIQYAHMVAWKSGVRQTYSFIHGTCPDCPSNRWALAGSIECMIFIGWRVPLEVAEYQLSCELQFLTHPDHPLNKVYFE